MLADQKWNLEKQIESLNNGLKGLDSALASTQEKEIDWALHGGIASGIAGGAAGLATAMEKQAKNAQIREQNQARLKTFAPVYTQSLISINNQIRYLKSEITTLNEEIDKAKIKLVDTPDESELIKKIYFSDTYVKISETGAFTVSTSVYQPYSIRIFDEVIAVIDGSISADLYQNNNKVGSAILVLPLHGIKKQSRVEGICLSGAKQDVPYEIKFTPHHLWTIEK